MISFIIKFSFYFTLSFLILSIPVKNRPLFYHLNKVTSPVLSALITKVYRQAKYVFRRGVDFSQKLFTNAGPKVDRVKSRMSSSLRTKSGEWHSFEDQKKLDKILE